MSTLQATDLIPGATYYIASQDERGDPWSGNATYVGLEDSGIYPEHTLEFVCEDGVPGMFDIEDVKYLTKDAPKPLSYWVRQLLNDLPAKRDWLNPVIEQNLRDLSKET